MEERRSSKVSVLESALLSLLLALLIVLVVLLYKPVLLYEAARPSVGLGVAVRKG